MEQLNGKTAFITGFYIVTHPEFRPFVEARHRTLLADFRESADLPLDPDWMQTA